MKRLIPWLLLAILAIGFSAGSRPGIASAQDEGWVIRSFDVLYELQADSSLNVTEDIVVDFGNLERHGIFRDMPVEYRYDDKNNRLIDVSGVSVTDGSSAIPFETSDSRPNTRIKIGDPDRLVSGQTTLRYQLYGARRAESVPRPRRAVLECDRQRVARHDRAGFGDSRCAGAGCRADKVLSGAEGVDSALRLVA